MKASKSINTVNLAIVILERDTEIEYEDWTIEVLLLIQAYYAATVTTKGYNEDQSSYNRAIKGPETSLWK
jgi:hypothetical protein